MAQSLALAKIFPDQDAVRVITQAGQTWFCNKDVCEVLGIQNPRSSYASLDNNDKTKIGVRLSNGVQEMGFISESGLYDLFLKSRTTEAQVFRKWVSSQILPSLRKNGSCALEDHERSRLLTIISDLESSKKQIEDQKFKIEQDLKKADEDKKHAEIKLQIADAENKHITILHENMKKKKTRFKCQKVHVFTCR
jgi:prophage antirepressor-like protein